MKACFYGGGDENYQGAVQCKVRPAHNDPHKLYIYLYFCSPFLDQLLSTEATSQFVGNPERQLKIVKKEKFLESKNCAQLIHKYLVLPCC